MAFIESPRFPDDLSYGSSGGPEYKTDVTIVASGYETRLVRWQESRHKYNAVFAIRHKNQLDELLAYFHRTRGMAESFRYRDPADFKSGNFNENITDTDQTMASITGSTTAFQLVKNYGGTNRVIKKPVANSVIIAVNSVSQSSGWSVDTTTGIVTFASAPSGAVTAGYEFDVPVRFDTDFLDLSLDNYLMASVDVPIIEVRV